MFVEENLFGDERDIIEKIEGKQGRARLSEITSEAEKARIERIWSKKLLPCFEVSKYREGNKSRTIKRKWTPTNLTQQR